MTKQHFGSVSPSLCWWHAQIYITLSKSEPEVSLALLQDCLLDVGDWMISSKLKLNPDKTEVLLFGTKLHLRIYETFPCKLLD